MKFIYCVLAYLVLAASPAQAANYFTWGVENNIPCYDNISSNCPYTVTYMGGTTRDCTVAKSGSCSMKLVVIGNDGNNQAMGADLIWNGTTMPFNVVRASSPLYYRWWMKIQTGFSWGTGSHKTKSSRVFGTNAGCASSICRGYTGYIFDTGFVIGECEDQGTNMGGCFTNTGVAGDDYNIPVNHNMNTMADSTWHEYVVMVKPNTSASCTAGTNCDAVFKVWIDNVLIGTYSNWKLNGYAGNPHNEVWGGWMVRPYFQLNGTASDGGTIYLDDFSTDDVYNSTIAKPGNIRVSELPQFMHYNIASYRSLGIYSGVL